VEFDEEDFWDWSTQ